MDRSRPPKKKLHAPGDLIALGQKSTAQKPVATSTSSSNVSRPTVLAQAPSSSKSSGKHYTGIY